MLLVAGCSKTPSSSSQIVAATSTAPRTLAEARAGNPEAVARPETAAPATAEPDPEPLPASATSSEIPAGTLLRVRVNQAISTRRNVRGDRFTATLAEPVMVKGQAVLPRGTRMHGHVLVSSASGRMKGRARLVLSLDSFERNGHRYRIDTTAASRVSTSHKKRNEIGIGGGSAIGAAIGAIAGGGKGALIGAGAGAAAGTVGAAVTGKKEVTIPAESLMRFTLGARVRV
jgi:hypothetical protein